MNVKSLMAALLLLLISSLSASGQCVPREFDNLLPGDGFPGDVFGSEVAVDGGRVLIGAPYSTSPQFRSGAVYAFEQIGGVWVETQKLLPLDSDRGDEFGEQIDLEGDVAVIGARMKSGLNGAAYVFQRVGSTWVEVQRLLPAAPIFMFGYNVSISQGWAAVTGDDAVCLFQEQAGQWIHRQTISVPYSLGVDAAMDGPVLVVASSRLTQADLYHFDGSSWKWQQTVTSGRNGGANRFAVDGNRVLIGADTDSDGGKFAGAAYVYEFDGLNWSLMQKLLDSSPAPFEGFGGDVALLDDLLAVTNQNEVVVFDFDGLNWVETRSMPSVSNLPVPAIEDSRVFVGDPAGSPAGSTLVFPARGLALRADENAVMGGDLVTLTTCGGVPFAPSLLVVTAIDGVPSFQPIGGLGLLDSDGARVQSLTVPAVATGLGFTLRSYSQDAAGRIAISPPEQIAVQ